MSIPNQQCGLTNFDRRFPTCPPNPNAIRSIVFSRDNLSVVNGPSTEIEISLKNLYVPVNNTARTSFTIPAKSPNVPSALYKLDLAGIALDEKVKFLGILPSYGTSSTLAVACGGTSTGSITEFVEWAFIDDIELGVLYDQPVIQTSSTVSFNVSKINKLEFSWGGYLSATASNGNMWIATDGGLLKWDGTETKLWNVLNSNSTSDKIKTIVVDAYNVLWSGSNYGLSKFTESEGFSTNWNTSNSGIISDNVNALKIYSTKLAVATDLGVSLFDKDSAWTNFSIFNTAQLHHNNFSSVATDSDYLFFGSTGGVYMYNYVTNTWRSSVFDTTIPGWDAPSNVTAIEAYDGYFYAGTTGGLVVVPYEEVGLSSSAVTILTGATGPASNYYKSIRLVNYFGDQRLYIGHDDGFSVYSINTDEWILASDSSTYPYLEYGIVDVLPDYLGTTSSHTVYFGSETDGKGVAKIEFTNSGATFSNVPEEDKITNLLFSFPLNPTCTPLSLGPGIPGGYWEIVFGNTNVDSSRLYPNNQILFFIFSKDMTGGGYSSTFEDFSTVSTGLTGSSSVVGGDWTWNSSRRLAVFTPTEALEKASSYNITVTNGSTSFDGSFVKEKMNTGFYTEDIVPALGWKPLGKMLVHTGTEEHYTQGLYLRNPQSVEVNFTALIGR